MSAKEVRALWEIACQDAGFDPDDQAVLYVVPGEARKANAAIHVEPGSDVVRERDWPLDRKQIDDANSPERRDAHRVLVRDFSSRRVALGRLRHELEHALQYERSVHVYEFMGVAQDVLGHAFHELDLPCWDGSAAIYNALPHEIDANRAAARLAAAQFGPPASDDLAQGGGVLFRDEKRVEPETLGRRLLATVALFPLSLDWVARERGKSAHEMLKLLGPDARVAWEALLADPRIAERGQDALKRCPSETEIRAGPNPASAWAAVVERIKSGQADAGLIVARCA